MRTVLVFVHYYLPGYRSGGPVRTLANIVERLGEDIRFRVVTADCDAYESRSYSGVRVDDWNHVGNAEVFYASASARKSLALVRLVASTRHDLLYLNSFFDPAFTVVPLLARRMGWFPECPVVLAPRGELARSALGLKAWKKRSYVKLALGLGLLRDITWHASSEHEARDIRRTLGSVADRIVVAPDLPALAKAHPPPRRNKQGVPLRIVFLSRISPIKNLDFALRVLTQVSVPVELDIYGMVGDSAYWRRCQALIATLPTTVSVAYRGAVDHCLVTQTLGEYDLFFLPTLGENYGHAIYEALAAGVPVLISNQTPWKDLEECGVGYVRRVEEPRTFVRAIETHAQLTPLEAEAMAARVFEYAQLVGADPSIVERTRTLLVQSPCGRKPHL